MNERRGTKGLELWCRKMSEGYPGVKIDNMTTSWRDGLAFCAIIHHFRPDLIDFSKLNKDDVYHNNELAFRIAEQYLGIPALLEPEDMVEYSVPDRLSILTYLSQFYQAFAVREGASPARIAPKRPQSSTDHGIVSPASTSPPTKVAFAGASIRREPCTKCGLPVFIAERLNVGKSLFHRTCFRCARCKSQLTLANYYETENNDYCCEICPDEEKVMSKTSVQKSVLLRSMSDEAKTASLKIVCTEPDEFSAMFETALEDADLEKTQTLNNEFNSARSEFFQSQILESGDSGNEESSSKEDAKPPDLPLSLPPTSLVSSAQNSLQYDSGFPNKNVSLKTSLSDNVESQNVVTKESVVKSRMRLFENDVNSKKVPQSPNASIPSSIKRVDSSVSDNKEDTKHSYQDFDASNDKYVLNKSNKDTSIITISDSSLNQSTSTIDESKDISNDSSVELGTSKISEIILIDSTEELGASKIGEVISIDSSLELGASKIEESIITIEDTSEQSLPSDIDLSLSPEKISRKKEESDSNNISFIDEDEHNEYTESINHNVEDPTKPKSETKEKVEIISYLDKLEEVVETVNYNVKDLGLDKNPETLDQEHEVVETMNYSVKESDLIKNKDALDVVQTMNYLVKESESKTKSDSILEKKESYPEDLNPFDDEEVSSPKSSSNPFGSDDEEEILAVPLRKPLPSPRLPKKKVLSAVQCKKIMDSPMKEVDLIRISINPFASDEDDDKTPVPATRKKKIVPKIELNPFSSDDDEENVEVVKKPVPVPRSSGTSSRLSELKHKEPTSLLSTSHNFGGSNSSISSGSYYGSARKKRPAPKPPIPSFMEGSNNSSLASTPSHSVQHSPKSTSKFRKDRKAPPPPTFTSTPDPHKNIERKISIESLKDKSVSQDDLHKEKIIKDEVNRNRQSHDIDDEDIKASVPNKSTYGKWKRKKGQAPAKPIPQKRTIKCLPMAEIKKELEFIEIQQQGLEKQGVRLEQIIRDKCEGPTNGDSSCQDDDIPIEVEDLILQLFELVNEKNELFRKQTELMYLRRQQRLEEEHADVEYQIRCLMVQPEANKTDSDKAREEELIKRLVEIVERRNEIVECLEKDRVREAEEDDSINNHINLFTLSRDGQSDKSNSKLEISKKENKKDKKKEKKSKNKSKSKIDIDKDVDESETSMNTLEKKKKKKFNLF